MKPIDYLMPIVTVASCVLAGKMMFFGFGQYLEKEWAFPFSLLQQMVYGMFPIALIGVVIVRIIAGQWLWSIKTATYADSIEKK